MTKKIPTEHLYFLLWCVYYLQGTLYPKGSIISQGILFILFVLSTIHFYRLHTNRMPRVFKIIDVFIAVFIIYGIIGTLLGYSTKVGGMSNVVYIKSVLISFLPIYSFCYYTIKGRITITTLGWWTVLLLFVYVLYYYSNLAIELAFSSSDEVTNNSGYLILSMAPLLFFLYKKPILQYLGFAIILLMTIFSMKRGAILICLLFFIIFVFKSINTKKMGKSLIAMLLLIIIACVVYFYINKLLDSSDYFNRRIEQTMEGNFSNREIIYSLFFNHFITQDNPFRFLFGSGAFATARLLGGFAHNDWLELAIDNGILGIIIYFLYWVSLFKEWNKSRKIDYLSNALTLALIYSLVRSFVSMSYLMLPLSISMVLGFSIARSNMGFPDYLKCNR